MGNCSFAVLLAKIATTRGNYSKGCGGAAKRLAEAFPLATRSADVHHNPQQTISLAKCSADAHHTLNKRFRSQSIRRTPTTPSTNAFARKMLGGRPRRVGGPPAVNPDFNSTKEKFTNSNERL